MTISAVINTYNEERNIENCLRSLSWVDEIVVTDMGSTDRTLELIKREKVHLHFHPFVGYVEPARNFAIEKAQGPWILLLDADEEVSSDIAKNIRYLISNPKADYFRIPRKNIIFGKWIQHGMWWPDYQVRFFRKGYVRWQEDIHSIPLTKGQGSDFPVNEAHAIIHHNYSTITQFIDRMNRYTSQQACESPLNMNKDFPFDAFLRSPIDEFLRRYFFSKGYKDGVHGLVLALLQGFSELIVVSKVWERRKFMEKNDVEVVSMLNDVLALERRELDHWQKQSSGHKSFIEHIRKFFS